MKIKTAYLFFACSSVALTALRVFQLLVMMEPETGFFYPRYHYAGVFIGVAVVLCSLLLLFFSYRAKDLSILPPVRSGGLRTACFLVFIGFAAYAVNTFAWEFLGKEGSESIMALISTILALLTAACFFYQATAYGARKPLLLILPASVILWTIFELTRSFMLYTGIANISENLFDVALLCTQLVFWSLHAKILAGDADRRRKCVRPFYGVGLITSLLSLLVVLPRYLAVVLGKAGQLHETTSPNPLPLTITIYILNYLFAFYRTRTRLPKRPAPHPAPSHPPASEEEPPAQTPRTSIEPPTGPSPENPTGQTYSDLDYDRTVRELYNEFLQDPTYGRSLQASQEKLGKPIDYVDVEESDLEPPRQLESLFEKKEDTNPPDSGAEYAAPDENELAVSEESDQLTNDEQDEE